MANPVISGQNMVRVGNLATDNLYVSIVGGSVTVAFPADTTTAAPGAGATGLVVRVAGSVPVAFQGIANVTTQTSVSVTGLPVWFAPGALVAISNAVSVDVTTGTPGATATAAVFRIPGIQVVTAQTSVSVSGFPVYFQPGALIAASTALSITGVSIGAVVSGVVSVSVLPAISISVSAVLGTIITISGLPAISISVSAILGTVIAISNLASVGTITAVVGVSNVTNVASIGTITAVVGVSNVTNVASVGTVTAIVGVSNVTLLVGAAGTTALVHPSSTGLPVINKDIFRQPFQIIVSSTIAGASSTLFMNIYTNGTQVTTGASFWVPGSRIRILGMVVQAVSSAVLSQANFAVICGTAAASLSVTATVGIVAILPYMPAATANYAAFDMQLDGPAGATTLALAMLIGTSHTIQAAMIQGFMF